MRWAVSGRNLSFCMSSERLQIILTGRPGTCFASMLACSTSSPSERRPKPPPSSMVLTLTLSGVVPAPIEARICITPGA